MGFEHINFNGRKALRKRIIGTITFASCFIMGTLGGNSQIKLDQDFTEAKLQAGLGGTGYYPVIHIASHFQFTPGNIDNSVLLLGDGSRLSLKQIETKLNFTGVELLTLSACETAVGDDTLAADGGEVEGLGAVAY